MEKKEFYCWECKTGIWLTEAQFITIMGVPTFLCPYCRTSLQVQQWSEDETDYQDSTDTQRPTAVEQRKEPITQSEERPTQFCRICKKGLPKGYPLAICDECNLKIQQGIIKP